MRPQLGDVLVHWGRLSTDDLDAALAEQNASLERERLGRVLMRRGLIDEVTLTAALATIHGLPSVDLDSTRVDTALTRLLPRRFTEKHRVLPLYSNNNTLTVAVADPVDVVSLDELRVRLPGDRLQVVVAPESQIRRWLDRAWGHEVANDAVREFVSELPHQRQSADVRSPEDEAASIKLVDQLLATAARRHASDLHLEPMRDSVRVRIRVDGMLQELLELPKTSLPSLVSRIKIMSGLDVVQRRLPQDGRIKSSIEGQSRELRVSTLPTIHGDKIVLRLLPVQTELPDLQTLGLSSGEHDLLAAQLEQPQGLVLVTGPTGAGKSTTLYAAMSQAMSDQRNVITLEDPVEVEMSGVTQVQINEKSGLTFELALRATLRQDPDVVMVGEIRDLQTATLATRAALTGHLVLSTLHTLDAPAAIARLVEMGIPNYLVAASLSVVLAQRLVRTPCPHCMRPAVPDPDTARRLELTADQCRSLVQGTGCDYCEGTGYQGRLAVFEVLRVDKNVRRAILGSGSDEDRLRAAARAAGWRPLLERAVEIATQRKTTIDEILRNVVVAE